MPVNRHKKIDPKIPHVSNVLTKGAWAGCPAVVLAGGPSLKAVLPRLVAEIPVGTKIASANMSWRLDPMPEVCFLLDQQCAEISETGPYAELWATRALLWAPGAPPGFSWGRRQVRVLERENAVQRPFMGTYWIWRGSGNDWGTDFGDENTPGLHPVNNAGLGALNLADILGADPIVLLGFDGYRDGEGFNWHQDYPDDRGWFPNKPEETWRRWNLMSTEVREKIRARVLNANPDSHWRAFEKVTFERAMEACREALQ